MKKTLISFAVVAGMAASGAALAEMKAYGNLHISLNSLDSQANGMDFTSNTSHFGVKASEDLGGGTKIFAKIEYQPDVADGSGLTGTKSRDILVGLKTGYGTFKFGAFSSNYKQLGGKVDPMYRTILEGRGGFLTTQSNLHNGKAVNRGRMTNQLQWTSSKMGGIQAVVNTTFSNAVNESTGFGIRYAGKGWMAFFDTISVDQTGASESATKFGGTYKMGAIKLGVQIENAADVRGEDYTFFSANYKLNKNDNVAFTFGTVSATAVNSDRTGLALMYKHKMSKMTNYYVGYGDRSDDTGADNSGVTFGLQKKF